MLDDYANLLLYTFADFLFRPKRIRSRMRMKCWEAYLVRRWRMWEVGGKYITTSIRFIFLIRRYYINATKGEEMGTACSKCMKYYKLKTLIWRRRGWRIIWGKSIGGRTVRMDLIETNVRNLTGRVLSQDSF